MGPEESREDAIGITAFIDIVPRVGLIAKSAARDAGETMLPSVSTPKENNENPAETPTAEPLEDPPAL